MRYLEGGMERGTPRSRTTGKDQTLKYLTSGKVINIITPLTAKLLIDNSFLHLLVHSTESRGLRQEGDKPFMATSRY